VNGRKKFKLIFIVLAAANFFAVYSSARAQQQTRLFKVGELLFRDRTNLGAGRQVFRQQLRELGYLEGKNIVFETRSAKGKLDRFPGLADELVRQKVDVLVASSTSEALAFKRSTKTIPVIFLATSDPVADGLVDSLQKPGSNVTGITSIATVLAGKRLELLKETVPRLSRVAVLWNPQDPGSTQQWKESRHAAQELGLQLHSMELTSAGQLDNAFKEAARAHITGLAIVAGSVATANPKLTTDLAIEHRLPAVFDRADYVTVGGLLSYGPDRADAYRRAAVMVDKVLKGTKPADIPVEQPTKFELVINLKTAKQIGLTIPPNVLARADKIIK